MKYGYHSLALLLACSLALTKPLFAADESLSFKEHLEKANNYIKAYRHFEAGDELKEAAKLGGTQHPSLYMRLGILYYGLGLIPEAIAEGEKAVALAPTSKWYKYDLAKFYYVDKQYAKAEEQFVTLLKLDPGFTLGYYYLGELYFRNKEYDMAWLCLKRANLLGHQGKNLEERLSHLTRKPVEDFAKIDKNNMIFRFIKLSSEEEAKKILKDIGKGKLFENLELELKKEKVGETDFGVMDLNELKDSVAESLRNRQPYSPPVIIKTGSDFRIMQRIAPFDPIAWRNILGTPGSKESKGKITAIAATTPKEPVENAVVAPSATPAATTPTATAATTAPEATAATTAAAVIATEPVSVMENTPKTPPTPPANDKEQLTTQLAAFHALESWKNAWQSADVPKYFAAYSNAFVPPDNMDMATWKKKRTASLTRPKYIQVTVKDPVVEVVTDKHILITFTQSYQSDNYHDEVVKILTMVMEQGSWKISGERTGAEPYRKIAQ